MRAPRLPTNTSNRIRHGKALDSRSSRWGGGVTADEMREIQWVKPKLVVQIRFVEWTADSLRHAALIGLRPDKNERDARREGPA